MKITNEELDKLCKLREDLINVRDNPPYASLCFGDNINISQDYFFDTFKEFERSTVYGRYFKYVYFALYNGVVFETVSNEAKEWLLDKV